MYSSENRDFLVFLACSALDIPNGSKLQQQCLQIQKQDVGFGKQEKLNFIR
jgi:hypothetical protein